MWDTTGMKKLTSPSFPSIAVVLYALLEWLSKKGRTPNELRVWLEKMMRTDVNSKNDDWELFFVFSMAAAQMDPNNKKKCPGHGIGTSHRHIPKILEMGRPEI